MHFNHPTRARGDAQAYSATLIPDWASYFPPFTVPRSAGTRSHGVPMYAFVVLFFEKPGDLHFVGGTLKAGAWKGVRPAGEVHGH